MLEDFYEDINVYEDRETDWDNPPTNDDGNLVLKGTIKGFLQTRNGSRPFNNQSLMPLSTHILYTDLGYDIIAGDYIEYLDEYYIIEYIPPLNGISGVFDHQEIGVIFQNEISGD
jgi:hypothetical protein